MVFIFKVHKNINASTEEFTNGLSTAKTCIESVLYDDEAKISISEDLITIDIENATAQELKNKIKGCFCDSLGDIYFEYQRIEHIS